MLPRMIKTLHRWTRLSSVKWEDAWVERLRFLGEGQPVFVTWPGSRALKIEVYCDERTGKGLVKRFGGRTTRLAAHIWSGDPARPRAPLAIRGKLKVHSDEASWTAWIAEGRRPPGIFIPAGMAFGTGEHATTATCLRFLADVAGDLPGGFRMLDLGTGSGILAVAGVALGAGEVRAIDYDPIAVRIARANARKNRMHKISCEVNDVVKIDARGFDVVAANVFSEVLISAARRISRATKPGGWLIFSGVLRNQADDVAGAFSAAGFSGPRIIARGKWCAGLMRRDVT